MAEQEQVNDRGIYALVQKVIGDLLPFDQYSRLRVYRTVGTFFGFDASYPKVTQKEGSQDSLNASRDPQFSSTEDQTPKEFLHQKQPKRDVERVACLAYYLSQYRGTPHFKTTDISKLNTEAAQIKLSNPSYSINNAIRSGYITTATKGMKQISALGEKFVEALPDQEAAKEIMKSLTKPKRSRKRNSVKRTEGDQEQGKSNE